MRTSEDRKRTVGTVLLLLTFVICFVLIVWWMYSVGLVVLPDRLVKLLGLESTDTGESVPWDTGELYSMLKEGNEAPPEGITFDLGYENLRLALLREPEPVGFYQNARITYYSDGTPKQRRTILRKNGTSFRIERFSDDTSSTRTELIIADEETVFIRDENSGESHTIARSYDIQPEHEAGFPSVSDLLAIVAQFPESKLAQNSIAEDAPRYIDTTVAMTQSEGTNVYYVAYTDSELDTREEYYISLAHRVVISHHTYYESELIYSFETLGFSLDAEDFDDPSLYRY